MDYANWRSLPAMFAAVARERGARPFLWTKREGTYRPLNWTDTAEQVGRLAGGLVALGVEPGDRVALVSENRPEWIIADLAIMSVGAVTVPAYVTNTVDDHRHILGNSGASAAIVSTAALAGRLIPAAAQVPSVRAVIAMERLINTPPPSFEIHSWEAVLSLGLAQSEGLAAREAAISPDDTACIIYTSGTGGVPKGVLLSHRNIIGNCRGAYRLLEKLGLGDEIFLCFLPLSHSYEHTAGMMFPISIGAQIYFAEGADTLASNLVEARPTIMTAVPRLYETMHQRIRRGMERERGLKRKLFERAVAIGRRRLAGEALSRGDRMIDPLADRLVRRKVQARFGGRLKAMVSGGAPLNPEIGSFFLSLGVRLLQGYGQTEAAPVICCNPPDHICIETVGLPLDGVRISIADDGEILVAGDNVMKGYWNDPEATARTLVDGWLRTGDVGMVDGDGYLRITDRKRDFIKNSGGDMISPARIEGALTLMPEIAQAMVFGDRRPYLVAIIVPDPEFAAAYAGVRAGAADLALLSRDASFHKALSDVVGRVNQGLPPIERVRRFIVAGEPFTQTNAQLTPTLKIRRHAIRDAYGTAFETLYDSKGVAA
ncbi:MAG TPA: long-chain fatty acid--CoA ligase [Stellaceae bacterium]|jgi:long-chain acyl-CoA synthetase|nr:long-chain fatty acid--CoA ligase [Stellaceae bacterium]